MISARRTALIVFSVLLSMAALPAAAGAATSLPQLETGKLNPAFVEALHDPMVVLGLGRLPSPVEVDVSKKAAARAADEVSLPGTYSLIALNRVTSPVKDQRKFNTCWAFANTAALESTILTRTGKATNLSENNLVQRSGYWTSRTERYYQGGWDFMAVAYFARWAGPVNDSADPYPYGRARGKTVKHVEDVAMIPGRSSDTDNDLVKTLVEENGGLSVGMYMDDSTHTDESTHTSYSYWDDATNSYYCPDTPSSENHGVVIVGWDDSYAASNFASGLTQPAGDGAFLVRNSWGKSWGDEGYFWVSYYDKGFARDLGYGTYGGCTSYVTVAGVKNFSHNYGYDKLGVTAPAGFSGSTSIWAANKFTAASARPITAVGFYTLSSNTAYQVWAGSTFKTMTRRVTGTSQLPGYCTIRFNQTPLRVKKGASFVVAIKLTSPGNYHPLAVEKYQKGFAVTSAKPGQSYVGLKRWQLVDLTTQGGYRKANVCLKAFAR